MVHYSICAYCLVLFLPSTFKGGVGPDEDSRRPQIVHSIAIIAVITQLYVVICMLIIGLNGIEEQKSEEQNRTVRRRSLGRRVETLSNCSTAPSDERNSPGDNHSEGVSDLDSDVITVVQEEEDRNDDIVMQV
jgi:hypothetical protein